MWHLHGNILTEYGLASNNRGRNEGNLATFLSIELAAVTRAGSMISHRIV